MMASTKRVCGRLAVTILVASLSCSSVFAAIGDIWELGDGIRASIPGGVAANGMNPATVGDATWTFRNGGGTAPYTTPFNDIRAAHGAFVELPPSGLLWKDGTGGPLSALAVFDGPNDILPCEGASSPCTNYGAGDVGGYTHTGAVWTTSVAGRFKVTWGGYAGRDFVNDPPRELDMVLFAGPAPYYDTTAHPGGRYGPFINSFTQEGHLGAANAIVNTEIFDLAAGDAVDLYINGRGPGDWAGLILSIEQIPEPTTMGLALLGLGGLLLTRRTRNVVPKS